MGRDQSVMWVDAQAKPLDPVKIGQRRVIISIAVDHVVWDFGDGASDRNGVAGKAYDSVNDECRTKLCPDYYGHVYTRTGTVTVRATVWWRASFTVDGGRPVAIPEAIDGPQAQAELTVKEARGVLVPN